MGTIVLLDDDAVILQLLRAVTEETGHTVVASRELDEIPSDVSADLVVTDLVPVTAYRREIADAWLQRLRARFGDARIVIVTGHAGALAEPDQLGVDRVYGKPFNVDVFVAGISALLL